MRFSYPSEEWCSFSQIFTRIRYIVSDFHQLRINLRNRNFNLTRKEPTIWISKIWLSRRFWRIWSQSICEWLMNNWIFLRFFIRIRIFTEFEFLESKLVNFWIFLKDFALKIKHIILSYVLNELSFLFIRSFNNNIDGNIRIGVGVLI